MNRPDLIEAFNDCVEQLQRGATVEDCLRRYPALADELRPLLESGTAVRRTRASAAEVRMAQTRVRDRLLAELGNQNVQRRPVVRAYRGASRLAIAAALVLVLAAIFTQQEALVAWLRGTTPTPEGIITLTPAESPSATLTASPLPTATESNTPTQTATVTLTPSLAPSATLPPSPTPTLIPESACVPAAPEGWSGYTIQAGDTLSLLAAVGGISLDELRAVNCLEDDLIRIDQRVFVPDGALPALRDRATTVPTALPAVPGTSDNDNTGGTSGTGSSNTNEDSSEDNDNEAEDDDSSNDNDSDNDNEEPEDD